MEDVTGRLFSLVELLQGRDRLTSAQLAARLGVSERTVRRDLIRLQELDLPVDVRTGRGGGVSLAAGSLLPPLRFTDRELLALVVGARRLSTLEEPALGGAARTALGRLESVLSEGAKGRMAALLNAVVTQPDGQPGSVDGAGGAENEWIMPLAQAAHQGFRVKIRYASADGTSTTREVDPYGLVRLRHWYLTGYCHLRADRRTFRLDRIRAAELLTARFERPAHFDSFEAVTTSIAQAPGHGELVCRVRVGAQLSQVSRHVPPAVVVMEPDEESTMLSVRVKPERLGKLALHLLELPFEIEVLRPPELATEFERVGKRALGIALVARR